MSAGMAAMSPARIVTLQRGAPVFQTLQLIAGGHHGQRFKKIRPLPTGGGPLGRPATV
jgi:hypothetical protein